MVRMETVERAVLALLALSAVAWLAVSYRNTQDVKEAFEISAAPYSPERFERGLDLVERAALLNPDRGETARLRMTLELKAGRRHEAVETAERYVRAEPDNSDAWARLADATRHVDPERSARARARWAELDPVGDRLSRKRGP
jgi:hypothetical protein